MWYIAVAQWKAIGAAIPKSFSHASPTSVSCRPDLITRSPIAPPSSSSAIFSFFLQANFKAMSDLSIKLEVSLECDFGGSYRDIARGSTLFPSAPVSATATSHTSAESYALACMPGDLSAFLRAHARVVVLGDRPTFALVVAQAAAKAAARAAVEAAIDELQVDAEYFSADDNSRVCGDGADSEMERCVDNELPHSRNDRHTAPIPIPMPSDFQRIQ